MSYSHVLITGATGLVGAHVVDSVLKRGVKVRVVVRSKPKAERMLQARPQWAHLLDFHFIDDLATPSVFDEAIKGIDGVIHVASPVTMDVKDVEAELMIPAIKGVQSMLEASAKSGTVKRVVLTSSFGSIINITHDKSIPHTYTPESWSPVTYEEATAPGANPGLAYCASKKFAEQAAWKFVDEHKPSFDLVTLCPCMIFGPIASPCDSPAEVPSSAALMWKTVSAGGELPFLPSDTWIDVRDLAEVHVLALTTPAAGGKRYIPASPERFSYQMVVDIVRREFPDWPAEKLAKGRQDVDALINVDSSRSKQDFPGVEYTSFRDTVVDFVNQVKALEARG